MVFRVCCSLRLSRVVRWAGVSGAHLKEGTFINKSLTTLGVVIAKLAKGTEAHIPYRESKLTRLLSMSLGAWGRGAVCAWDCVGCVAVVTCTALCVCVHGCECSCGCALWMSAGDAAPPSPCALVTAH
jgi:hypothetical protein